MVTWKLPISRCKLSLFSSLMVMLAHINLSLTHYEMSPRYSFLILKIVYGAFFISLLIFFLEKKLPSFLIFIATFLLVFFYYHYGVERFFLHYSFEFYKRNNKDIFSQCVREEYHNPDKQILAYCFSTDESEHDFDRDIMYDSGNELPKPDSERSCEWNDAFKKLAMKSSSSMLYGFAQTESIDAINFYAIDLGSSYYEVRYSIEPLYTPLAQKNSCK